MKKLFTLATLLLFAGGMASAQFITKALNENDEPTFDWSKTEKFIPIAISATVGEAMGDDVLFDATVNDATRFLYVWENTYAGVDQDGSLNSFGQPEDHVAMDVAYVGWSGCGFCASTAEPQDWSVLDDSWVLHFAIKSKDAASHRFAVAGTAAFTLGQAEFEGGKLLGDFPRDDEWYYVDVPYSVIRELGLEWNEQDGGVSAYTSNYLTILSGGVAGTQLRLDNIFWYKDKTIEVSDTFAAGDVDGSGIIDVDDVNAIINIILGKNTADEYKGVADVDKSGIVDVDDVNEVVNIILAN